MRLATAIKALNGLAVMTESQALAGSMRAPTHACFFREVEEFAPDDSVSVSLPSNTGDQLQAKEAHPLPLQRV
jgi:hypothetical protein